MEPLLPAIEVATNDDPQFAVIWMHGLGADGSDFEPVVPELGLAGDPGVRFIFSTRAEHPGDLQWGLRDAGLVRHHFAGEHQSPGR